MKEPFEQRLFRIFAQAGYSPVQLLTVTPEEMVEIPGITVPNIRAVLCVQNKVLADRNKIRSGRLVEELLKEAGGLEVRPCAGCTCWMFWQPGAAATFPTSILPRSCAGWRCPTYAGWRKTPIRSINGRTRFVTSRGMNGSLPV